MKSYLNNAVVGNSSILGCVSEHGEMIRLYWPNIDYMQQIDKILTGYKLVGEDDSFNWFSEATGKYSQTYLNGSNILITTLIDERNKIEINQKDFCLHSEDGLIRNYIITNHGDLPIKIELSTVVRSISNTDNMSCAMIDPQINAMIFYNAVGYMGVFSKNDIVGYQLNQTAFDDIKNGGFHATDETSMSDVGGLSWETEIIYPGQEASISIRILLDQDINNLKQRIMDNRKIFSSALLSETNFYWKNFVSSCNQIETGNERIDYLYKRSLLLFCLMWDKKTGGLLAAPEIDEGFSKCGRYAYCWGRDAAFITAALDTAGLHGEVDHFYEWAKNTQDIHGFWHQRYYMNGRIAPSWGMQIDETGTIVYGVLEHYKKTKRIEFLQSMWETVKKAADFMCDFIDEETQLPKPSFDLWEERFGEHAYSSAAVYSGLVSAEEIGKIIEADDYDGDKWHNTAKAIKAGVEKFMWDEERGTYLRSIRVKLNPWGPEPTEDNVNLKINDLGLEKTMSNCEENIDISLLGMSIPFNLFNVWEDRMVKCARMTEEKLKCYEAGGLYRYEGDNYAGGNPWIITTLWAALYYIEAGNIEKAKEYFYWVVDRQTNLGLLPEQSDRITGEPKWVIPLTWSHAMYVLVLDKLKQYIVE